MDENKVKHANSLTIPLAIVIAGVLIAGAVFITKSPEAPVAANTKENTPTDITVPPVIATDHLLGNPNATITVIEYSDLECPFCKTFHQTLHRLMDDYGKTGQLAWVYRQFPLPQLHSKAPKEAEASECAAELGGNTAFWNFIDKVFEVTPSNDGLDPAFLPQIAKDIGLNVTAFNTCLSSGKYTQKIQKSYEEAVAAGGSGTPYSIFILKEKATDDAIALMRSINDEQPGTFIVSEDKMKIGMSGALSYGIVNTLLTSFLP